MIKKTKLNYRAVDYLQILIIKYEELLQTVSALLHYVPPLGIKIVAIRI